MATPLTGISDHIKPAPHEAIHLDDLSDEQIRALGERILRLDQDPGEHGAFVARANHLLGQGHSADEITAAYVQALGIHADQVGGEVYPNDLSPNDVRNGKDLAWPHIDRSNVVQEGKPRNIIIGNMTHEGTTSVITAKEQRPNGIATGATLTGMKNAIANSTSEGLPPEHLTDVVPSSFASSVLEPGDAIFMRSGGYIDGVETPGTGHSFDIGPNSDTRTTQPITIQPPHTLQ